MFNVQIIQRSSQGIMVHGPFLFFQTIEEILTFIVIFNCFQESSSMHLMHFEQVREQIYSHNGNETINGN